MLTFPIALKKNSVAASDMIVPNILILSVVLKIIITVLNIMVIVIISPNGVLKIEGTAIKTGLMPLSKIGRRLFLSGRPAKTVLK